MDEFEDIMLNEISPSQKEKKTETNSVGFHSDEVLRVPKFVDTERSRMVVARSWEERGMGSNCVTSIMFQL